MLQQKIEEITQEVIAEKVKEALDRINATFPNAEWRSNGRIEPVQDGVNLYWDNELLVYFSAGTGAYASAYLSSYSQEVQDEFMKFFVNGLGKTESANNMLPVIFDTEIEITTEINKRVEDWFKGVKL